MNSVLSALTGTTVNDPRSVIDQGFIGSSAATAGCFIKTQQVYSICTGVVISVERDPRNSTWAVTIEVTSQKWVRYCGLGAVKVVAGENISVSDLVGFSHRGLMRLEYCTSESSQFPVRVVTRQLYKQDPTPIIFGQEIFTEG